MKHVRQTNQYNCESACIAMVLGLSIEVVEQDVLGRRVGDLKDARAAAAGVLPPPGVMGVNAYEICAALTDRGYPCLHIPSGKEKDDPDFDCYGRTFERMPILDPFVRLEVHADNGGIAVLGVDSLTRRDGGHWVVSEGTRLYDPQVGNVNDESKLYRRLSVDNPIKVADVILVRPRER